MKRFLSVLIILFVAIFSSTSFAQTPRPSGATVGKGGWTAEHELMYRYNDSVYIQRLQKRAKKEAYTNPNGPANTELRNRQTTDYIGDLFRINK